MIRDRVTFRRLGPSVAAMARLMMIWGNARNISVSLIITSSKAPRRYPARVPSTIPIVTEHTTTITEIPMSTGRAATTWEKMSLPSKSVPKKCASDGPRFAPVKFGV